ncbi:acyl-CoA ligase (AMP-forming), exosortase A system-associated [Aliiglaciecola sp. CAU 1673]|uniref:acyl-CoA ligase (AMP-forming), exosortase A system-associated n=1 Tax=Aliiglaciecola sp. CAU 1673 TaxID=3032595 RepID=UPI0023DB8CEE|nr:acyl-CoA ligase (AMP-forming), exosortase A system-associated [Aliiglaciecola sp. CAU 1673]MDF2177315.1 acyl-CoA ligase (AMP-forming), exosortase A system-associated [Aliiglaciecola sp. CAU 1673]
MATFFHQLVTERLALHRDRCAIKVKNQALSYAELATRLQQFAGGLGQLGLTRHDRIGVFLPKLTETVVAFLGASAASGVFVPINPVLKPIQVQHILTDCDVKILVTSSDRLKLLEPILADCPALIHIILVDKVPGQWLGQQALHLFADVSGPAPKKGPVTEYDMAAILYTSGSTGKPKGVVLSHRNLVVSAQSVAEYLENDADDVLLALLPLSFDYGLSQLSTAFLTGATVVLMDYLLPGDVVKAVDKHNVTGLAAVPPLWQQLMKLQWPVEIGGKLRYFTNSGGAMPSTTLAQLRQAFPNAKPYLMYGLTEAFRSTYLPPALVDERPGSMGKAIPNAEIMVVREDGSECAPDEPGELVHRGPHVSLGYWNAPEKTAERFKPVPRHVSGLMLTEMAVWSGDTVKKDADGFLYFVGRKDEMIKTSGYRVSPAEVEEACYAGAEEIAEIIATGVPDAELGQAIVVYLALKPGIEPDKQALLNKCKKLLPNFMHPKWMEILESLPRNPNGKVDRALLGRLAKETYANE